MGLDLTAFQDNGQHKPISRVTLWVDDSNCLTAGDDTGAELEADCPFATQSMVEAILAQVEGYQYQAYTASDADIDPAAELGDGVTASGVYSVLARVDDDGSGYPSLAAPGEQELEEEYPAEGPLTQEFNRQIAETRSQITKTSEEILLQVDDMGDQISAVSVRLDEVSISVQGANNQISSISTKLDSITLSVSNGSTSSVVTLTVDGVTVSSQTISMSGLVTFTGLADGTTTIDGACIQTGTISASRLNLTNYSTTSEVEAMIEALEDGLSLTVTNGSESSTIRLRSGSLTLSSASITFTGMVTFTDLSTDGSTSIHGGNIITGTLEVNELYGRYVYLIDASGNDQGRISITDADTTTYAIDLQSYGALRLRASSGAVYLESSFGHYILISNDSSGIAVGPSGEVFRPSTNGTQLLGSSSYRWSDVYATNGTIQTSDRNEKTDIDYDMGRYEALFDAVKPCSFRFLDGTRTHWGVISQDFEEAMTALGFTGTDIAAFCKDAQEDGSYSYGMRYTELVPLLIWQVQQSKAQITELKARITELEGST